VRVTKRKNLTLGQKQEILELWNKEYPENLQYDNISELDDYLNKLEDQNHILLIDKNDKIKGWYSDFIRENERWFLAILNSEIQGRNFGTQLIELAKKENEELSGWVINSDNYFKANGEIYKSPVEFYRKNGFKILYQTHLKTDKISAIKVQWSKTGYNIGYSK
jgi:GNAT superfamily N-acetyltransferase